MSLVSGINSIDALVGASWNPWPHMPRTLSFAFFGNSLPGGLTATDAHGYRPMDAQQQQAVRDAFAAWAAVANLAFSELPQGVRADINLGTNDQGFKSSGYADLPGDASTLAIFMNNATEASSRFDPGSFGFSVLMHEIGHTLGLKHPGPYDTGGGAGGGPYLPAEYDTRAHTQMSYHDAPSFAYTLVRPVTPMLYDIQAVQYLYGPNMAWRTGDDVYRFDAYSLPQCVWDAGGSNTFDFSASGRAAEIDLHAGAFSSSLPGARNISIAYGVRISSAIGTAQGDTIVCNDDGNAVAAGAGNDRILPGAGADSIDGGAGIDIAVLDTMRAACDVTAGQGYFAVAVHGQAADRLAGVERLHFTDTALALDIDGSAGASYRLYQAALGRAPDLAGLSFWIGRGDAGTPLEAVAQAFVDSAEFSARYGAPDNGGYIALLYANVLHRAPDAAGLQWHLAQLQSGMATRATALLAFSESAENQAALVGQLAHGIEYLPGAWPA